MDIVPLIVDRPAPVGSDGGETTGSKEALQALKERSYSWILLAIMAIEPVHRNVAPAS